METIDTLYNESIKLVQSTTGYRFSLDPILLADFVRFRGVGRGLDLGSGCGILALLLARRCPDLQMVGWELQRAMAERAQRSARLSGQVKQVTIINADLRRYCTLTASGAFDLVVTNPPYRVPGTGRVAPNDERAAARHELAGGLTDFLAASSWALKNGGRFAIVYLVDRLSELLTEMTRAGLEPKRLRMVHPYSGQPAKMVLVEGLKGAVSGLRVEAPLFIYRQAGGRDYTEEILQIYADRIDGIAPAR